MDMQESTADELDETNEQTPEQILRNDIQSKWKKEIGDVIFDNKLELAQNMSAVSKHVVEFIVNCHKILESANPAFNAYQEHTYEK